MRSIWTKLTGSAPVCSTSAMFFASPIEPIPVICALVPAIPSGYWLKSICGYDWIWPSSTIAKCCGTFVPTRLERRRPRWASIRVILWNSLPPLPVNCISTTGWPVVGSKSACVPESFRSLPVISGTNGGLYLKR